MFLFFGADIKSALDHPEMNGYASNEEVGLRSSEDLVRSVLAEIGPAKTPVTLKDLVTELQLVTPLINQTDCDGDGLWDIIESVIGTDFNDTDSDRDTLNDTYEVFNDLDPLAADSNEDGIPDNHEIRNVLSLDIDGDGTPNAWDFDNDNDGVSDAIDLSPNAKSSINDAFDIQITTDGKPLYISFQIVPDNPLHTRLVDQWWDWPNDTEDRMQDLDGSQKDVQVLPFLNLSINFELDQRLVEGYPMLVTYDGLLAALTSVYDSGSVVALESRIHIPEMTFTNLSLHAELIWKVVGYTDRQAIALMDDEGAFLSSYSNGLAVANATDLFSSSALQKIDLADGMIALRMLGGGFLSVSPNGLLYFNGTELGQSETFMPYNTSQNQMSLRSIATGMYVATGANGLMIANSTSEEVFQIADLGIYPEPITLEIYDDSFRFSGISVQECYYTNMGVYYSNNRNQTIAAQGLLSYDFLRNSTTTLWDIPAVLADHEIGLMYQNQSFRGVDHAYVSLSNDLLPHALDTLPSFKILPVIIAGAHRIKIADLSEVLEGTYVAGHVLCFDLGIFNTSDVKSLSCYFYNTTTYEALTIGQIMDEIRSWGYDDITTEALMITMCKFTAGEWIVCQEGFTNEVPDVSIVESWVLFAKGVFGTFGDDILKITCKLLRTYFDEHFMMLKTRPRSNAIWSEKALWQRVTTAGKAVTSAQKVSKFFRSNAIGILCIVTDVGLSIYAAFLIAEEIGGRLGQEIGATYGVISSIVSLVIGIHLLVIAMAGPIGFAIAAVISLILGLAELCGGVISKFVEWLTETIFGSVDRISSTLPLSDISDIRFETNDSTLSVGDRLTMFCKLIGNVTGSGTEQRRWVGQSYSIPWISMDMPSGSNSATGSSDTADYDFLQNTLFGIVPGDYWEARMYNYSVWIEPDVASPNFPVAIGLHTDYHIWDIWSHSVLGLFDCRHEDEYFDSMTYVYTRIYFDVMPDSLDAFVEWRSIHAIDSDMDGLNNTIESSYGSSSRWSYDTDCDELNDAFEVTIGTDPRKRDSDDDSLSDYYECLYGTNATDSDSDGDGLFDYLEIAGWQIRFDYMSNSSLPFEMLVTSSPWMNDSDGDDVVDFDEYQSHLNPRSGDTNGDRHSDEALPRIRSYIDDCAADVYVDDLWKDSIYQGFLHTENESYLGGGLAFSDEGYIYVPNSVTGVERFYTNFTVAPVPSHYFPDLVLSVYPYAQAMAVDVDNANDWIYVIQQFIDAGSWAHTDLYQYSLDGSVINPGSWTQPTDGHNYDVVVGADSSVFLAHENYIVKYSSTGMLLATWAGPSIVDQQLLEVVVDDVNGLLYATDRGRCLSDIEPGRIIRLNATDGSYLGSIPKGPFYDMCHIAVDDEGYIYAIGKMLNGSAYICKFDRNGMEDMSFRKNLYDLFGAGYCDALYVDQGYIYICYYCDNLSGTRVLWKLHQVTTSDEPCLTDDNPDWDGDGLTNQLEVNGWEITVAFNATCTMTFNVTSDPRLIDTDGDHLSDYLEYNLTSNPQCSDSDADGASDHQEWWMNSHPGEVYVPPLMHPHFLAPDMESTSASMASTVSLTRWDSDGDLLGDGVELAYGSNPTLQDSDGDSLSDLVEFQLNSDPNKIDTDDDEATDAEEYTGNSSLLVADSDGDFAFDGAEYDMGSSPLNADVDEDGIVDGDEALFGTNPFSSDSDGDNVSDWMELSLWLDPLNNDSDGDGVLDGVELEWGSNPWSHDSDRDGVPDGEDPDTFITWYGPIVLAYDIDEQNQTLSFAEKLQDYTTVIMVSVDELMHSYTEYPYIVLVGRPDADSDTVAGLTYSLLADTGSVLGEMMEPESHEVATRYGYWTDPQTIVILSEAYDSDVYTVLQILRGRNISILLDSVYIEYLAEIVTDNVTYAHAFEVNEIDTVKSTDTILSIALSGLAVPILLITRYNDTTTPYQLTSNSGLAENEVPLGKYIGIDLAFNGVSGGTIQSALIQIYYKALDLDFNRDGIINQMSDLNETSLCLYWYDEETSSWVKLSEDLDWVLDWGLNTIDLELYGEHYAGFIWVQVTHFSLFAVAGELIGAVYPDLTYLAILVGCFCVVAAIILRRKRKGRFHTDKKTS